MSDGPAQGLPPNVKLGQRFELAGHSLVSALDEFAEQFLPDALVFLSVFIVTLFLTWFLSLSTGVIMGALRFSFHVRRISQYLVSVFVFLVGLTLAFGAIGIDFGGVVVAYGFVGLTLSWGLSGVISNAAAAFWLQMDDAMQPGHYFILGSTQGRITDMSFKHIELRTASGDVIYVPNSMVLGNPVRISLYDPEAKRPEDERELLSATRPLKFY